MNKDQKYSLWIARLFIPVLWPIRFLIVLPVKKAYYTWMMHRYPMRLKRAKSKAIKRNKKTGKKQFGIKIGSYVKVWSRDEIKMLNSKFSKKLGKPFDYRKFVLFTCENEKIKQ